jgi:hypothetical protein
VRIPFGQPSKLGGLPIRLDRELVATVLRTVEVGWRGAAKRVDMKSNGEIAITEVLREEMRSALAQGKVGWYRQLEVLDGTESWSRPGLTRPDGVFDIPLVFGSIRDRTGVHSAHAIIECKRISPTDTALVRAYVAQGIDRFCSGQYAKDHANGFMIGYVVAGCPADAVASINTRLTTLKRSSETLSAFDLRPAGPFWRSQHPRQRALPVIAVHHTMLGI